MRRTFPRPRPRFASGSRTGTTSRPSLMPLRAGRPRPTIRPKDEDREKKLQVLRALLKGLPADETAVFMDEVDVNLNPKVGCMWMLRGQQATVDTPGNNVK